MSKKDISYFIRNESQEKRLLNHAIDYSFDYIDRIVTRNVFPTKEAINNLSIFDEPCPVKRSNGEEILSLLNKYGSPATVAQTGGRYFGFVSGGMLPISLAARWLSDCWDQNALLFISSPIMAKLELIVEDWLKEIFKLPNVTVAGFVSGTSMATFCGLAAARYKILSRQGWDLKEKGLRNAPEIKVILSTQAHSSVIKALTLLGIGKKDIAFVEADNQGRIKSNKITCIDNNTILILQAGNVNSGSFDPFISIIEEAKSKNAWVHVDGAFGLWALASKRFTHLTQGINLADSWSVDAHKTLNTPYDNGIILCKDKEALVSALHAGGDYLMFGNERDNMLYTPDMSRRGRIVELWAAIKYLGKQGIEELVNHLNDMAILFTQELKKHDFHILNEVVFNQVLVACDSDELTKKTLEKIQELRICWCGGTVWNKHIAIRISICSWATDRKDIKDSVNSFVKARLIAIKQLNNK